MASSMREALEKAGVRPEQFKSNELNKLKELYGKFPVTESKWKDFYIKIGNGLLHKYIVENSVVRKIIESLIVDAAAENLAITTRKLLFIKQKIKNNEVFAVGRASGFDMYSYFDAYIDISSSSFIVLHVDPRLHMKDIIPGSDETALFYDSNLYMNNGTDVILQKIFGDRVILPIVFNNEIWNF